MNDEQKTWRNFTFLISFICLLFGFAAGSATMDEMYKSGKRKSIENATNLLVKNKHYNLIFTEEEGRNYNVKLEKNSDTWYSLKLINN